MLTNTNETDRDDEPTQVLPPETMATLVYGRPIRRARIPGALLLALALLAGAAGCNATAPAPEPETVGQLAASYHSVSSAPVHATTNLSPGFHGVDTDEGPAVGGAVEQVEVPAVTAKAAHGF